MNEHTGLWQGFVDPPDDARPRAWWHWLDGNVDPAGINLDLDWLHRSGVRGVQMFTGAMGNPPLVPEAVQFGDPAWKAAVRLAAERADALGIEFSIATSPGWSATGGPWVKPDDAMRKVVWSETIVDGEVPSTALEPLPDVAGAFQDAPRWQPETPIGGYVVDTVTVAVPYDDRHEPLQPDTVLASNPIGDHGVLTDGSFAGSVRLPRATDAASEAWIDYTFDHFVTVTSATVGLSGPTGFGAAPEATATLEARDDHDGDFRLVAEFPPTGIPARTRSFPAVASRHFRLRLHGLSLAAALPPTEEGLQLPPLFRAIDEFVVTEFALHAEARVDRAELKAGFGAALDYEHPHLRAEEEGTIKANQVTNVSADVVDGVLVAPLPPGRWRIIRFGASLTGHQNGPAQQSATGLEVDKLDADCVRGYFDTYLDYYSDVLTSNGPRIHGLLADSIEAGSQNWTTAMLSRFETSRGYDPVRWLPALAGYVVDDAPSTDRFLWDWRRVITELVSSDYYTTLASVAHAHGLISYAEALEDHRPQLGDDLAMRAAVDVPMGAMWMFDSATGPRQTFVADLKGASSVAHVWDKVATGAESFTRLGRPWSETPRSLKHVADLEISLGVTRFCIHTSPHQPENTLPPGQGLAPIIGQSFNRLDTWSASAKPWVDYLARCSYLTNAGEPAAVIALYLGEETPATARYGDTPLPELPDGVDFDFVNLEALEQRLTVDEGMLVAGGARYLLLHLGEHPMPMTVRALNAVQRLVERGAAVAGPVPLRGSPSLSDDPLTHARLIAQLWGTRLVEHSTDLAAAIAKTGFQPALQVKGGPVRRIDRRTKSGGITFLANPVDSVLVLDLEAADVHAAIWNPVDGSRRRLTPRLALAPYESVFIVSDPTAPHLIEQELTSDFTSWSLSVPGAETIELAAPSLWTDIPQLPPGFSGTATYRSRFSHKSHVAVQTILQLGVVHDLASVRVNGKDCGIAWTAPFRVDITSAIRTGENELEIDVTNAWRNRLIVTQPGTRGLYGPATEVYSDQASVDPAGLAGPVTIITMTEAGD